MIEFIRLPVIFSGCDRQISSGPSNGKSGVAASAVHLSAECQETESEAGRSDSLESSRKGLDGVEGCTHFRETRYCHSLATQALQKALEEVVWVWGTGPTTGCGRNQRADSDYVVDEPDVGFATNRGRTGEDWHYGDEIDCGQISSARSKATLPDVAHIHEKPCKGIRVHRFHGGAHRPIPDLVLAVIGFGPATFGL